tara:strand:- start:838 stop:1710 length:873 start_codon:yes stop_codon:yes gene_type:complete
MAKNKLKSDFQKLISSGKKIFSNRNQLKRLSNINLLDGIEDLYNISSDSFLIIEIGANDGMMNDRFYEFIIKNDPNAIFVEPIPDYYEALKNNYINNKNSVFVNAAIDIEISNKEMHYIPYQTILDKKVKFRMEQTPEFQSQHWAMGLGTFHPTKNNIACPELSFFRKKINVKTITFNYLFNKYKLYKYDNIVIQTDCEGHDYMILKTFPFEKIKPKVYISEIFSNIRYPESHPNYTGPGGEGYIQEQGLYTKSEEEDAKNIFKKYDYSLFRNNDLIALDKSILQLVQLK